jgi:hypothetical protein
VETVKEFLVYTGLRLGLFVSAFIVVAGVWSLLSDEIPLLWPLLIAMLASAVASAYFLKGPRDRLAAKVSQRAERASEKFEEMRSKEDED